MPTWNPPAGPPPASNEHYSVAGNWTGGVPTSATDAIFDGSVSNRNCIINNTTLNCFRFRVINGYSGTITFTNNLNVYGNYEVDAASATSWTFSAIATRGLYFRASASIDIPITRIDSNIGMSILTSGVSITLTLARDTTIANFLATLNNPNTNVSFIINRTSAGNGDNLFVTSNFAHGVFTGVGFFGGTTTINFTSSTTSVIAIGSQGVRNNMIINGSGTFTGTIGLGTGNTTTYLNGNTVGLSVLFSGSSTIISNGTTWFNITFSTVTSQTATITTDLISGGVISATTSYGWAIVHIGGSVIRARGSGANNLNLSNADIVVDTAVPCTVSLSNQNSNMDLVFNPFPGGQITWQGGTFIGTASTFTYLTSNGGPTPIAASGFGLTNTSSTLTINTSPSPTNYIIFPSYLGGNVGGLVITLLSDLHINGSASINSATHIFNGVGYSVICGGNSSLAFNTGGTASIQLSYTGTWNSPLVIGNDLIISPFAGQTVTIQTMAKGVTNKSITYVPGAGTLNSSASALSVATAITVPMSTFGMTWGSITVGNNTTLTLNSLLNLSGSLILSGNTTFTGSYGFTTQNLTCTTASSTITLQNITANPLAEYRVNGVLTLLGTLANRITLQAAGSASFNGTITPVATLNYLSGVSPSIGMTVSQSTGFSPAQLNPANRPVITSGVSPTFTITPPAGGVILSSLAMRAGYKAKFILTNNGTSSQNVTYVTTQDIDSNGGVTILSFGSNGDDINNSTVALFRTLNWGPLVAPSGSVYYTFVT